MASTSIGKWNIETSFDGSGMSAGAQRLIDESARAKAGVSKNLDEMGMKARSAFSDIAGGNLRGGISTLQSSFSGILGTATKIAETIAGWVTQGQAALRMQERFAAELGVSRNAAAALMTAGGIAGMDPGQLRSGALRTISQMGELRMELAAGGSGGSRATAFRMLGIEPGAGAAMQYDQLLGTVGDRLRGVASAQDRAFISAQLLGREWREMTPLLSLGSDRLARLERDAQTFGVTADDAMQQAVRATRAEIVELGTLQSMLAQGAQNQFAGGFAAGRIRAGGGTVGQQTEALRAHGQSVQQGARGLGEIVGIGSAVAEQIVLGPITGALSLVPPPTQMEPAHGPDEPPPSLRDIQLGMMGNMASRLEQELDGARDAATDLSAGLAPGTSGLLRQVRAMGELTDQERSRLEILITERNELSQQERITENIRREEASRLRRAESLAEAGRSPLDRIRENFGLLRGQLDEGRITRDQFQRGLGGLLNGLPTLGPAPSIGALQFGSAEAASVITASLRENQQGDRQQEILEVLKAMKEQEARTNALLERIMANAQDLADILD